MWQKTLFLYIPVINFVISTTAFGYQIAVINPSQKIINNQHKEIINLLKKQGKI